MSENLSWFQDPVVRRVKIPTYMHFIGSEMVYTDLDMVPDLLKMCAFGVSGKREIKILRYQFAQGEQINSSYDIRMNFKRRESRGSFVRARFTSHPNNPYINEGKVTVNQDVDFIRGRSFQTTVSMEWGQNNWLLKYRLYKIKGGDEYNLIRSGPNIKDSEEVYIKHTKYEVDRERNVVRSMYGSEFSPDVLSDILVPARLFQDNTGFYGLQNVRRLIELAGDINFAHLSRRN